MSSNVLNGLITQDDIFTLVRGESSENRANITHKICRQIEQRRLTEEERLAAEEILRIVAQDAAEMVRRALAVTLRNSPKLPRDVAKRLAKDADSIALPVISCSPQLTDDDLIEVLQTAVPSRQRAVASRPVVSEKISDIIVQVGDADTVKTLTRNKGARMVDSTLSHALERFNGDQELADVMAQRPTLPAKITEKLVTLVSEQVRDHLVNAHELPPEMALEIATGTRERATIDLIAQAGLATDMPGFVAHLRSHGRLTPSMILRALCQGHMKFFEWAMAELGGLPHHRSWLMIHDAGPLGLKAVYERANLPPRLYPAFRIAVDVYHSLEMDGRAGDQERFAQRMMERVLTQANGMSRDDVDYLLDKMDKISERMGHDPNDLTWEAA